MGNQMSSVEEKHKDQANEIEISKPSDKLGKKVVPGKEEALVIKDTFSSYKGLKSDNSADNENTNGDKSISNDTTSVVTAHENVQDVKISTPFEWKEGGHMVYVAGSFSNWTQWFVMTKNKNTGQFELLLDLPRGVHQYKFIVDNKWIHSKHHPTCKDERGNINNIIDTNLLPQRLQEKEPEKEADTKKVPIQVEELKKNLAEAYTEYFPKKNEMNLDAPNAPAYYATPFDIDYYSHQNSIGHKKYLNFSMRNGVNENNSFKNITLMPHVNLYLFNN